MSAEKIWLAGTISVKAALEEHKRTCLRLVVNPKKKQKDIAYIISLAKRNHIPVEYMEKEAMNEIAAGNGGVLLECEARKIPSLNNADNPEGLAVYICGVEDPYNFGSIARTLYAFGASMMIVQDRDWKSSESVLIKASAGAWERLNVCSIQDESQLEDFKNRYHLPMWSAYRSAEAIDCDKAPFTDNMILVVGGAMRGISAKVLEASDGYVVIPYGRDFRNALDAPSASSVLAYAWMVKTGKAKNTSN